MPAAGVQAKAYEHLEKQVRHAIKRPKKRVFMGEYHDKDGVYNVYVSVEKRK
jgi:hypothetical protein